MIGRCRGAFSVPADLERLLVDRARRRVVPLEHGDRPDETQTRREE
jgi:hypothetical protein